MRYKKMVIEWNDSFGEPGGTDFLVTPESASVTDEFFSDNILCHVYTDEGADLIVKLLNRHYSEH